MATGTMTPDERSRALREEADTVLDRIGLRDLCAPIGDLLPTGSYFMDLMMYPDIDLYLPPAAPERLLGVATELSKLECVRKINFMKGGPAELKDGLYLKPVVAHGNWERPWKIDIWSLHPSVAAAKQKELEDLKTRMTARHHEVILDTKLRLLTDKGRTPMFSGIYIYKAVIDDGLERLEDVSARLRANGINV